MTTVSGRARGRRALAALLVTTGALTWVVPARALDPATARALFDQGRQLMSEERWSEACPKLEESQRLDPAGGTLLHLALCRENEGRTATAWALYQDALSQAKRDARRDRAKIAQQRIEVLGPQLARIRVKVAAENKDTRGFMLARDDAPVGRPQWDEAFPVDPGKVVFRATAPGKKPLTVAVDVPARPGEVAVEIRPLEDDPNGGADPARAGDSARREDARRGDGQRMIAYTTAGVGVAGLVVGSVFGLVSMSKKSSADAECRPPDYRICTANGVALGNEAIHDGNVSTVAFIAGAALLAAGVVLYFAAPTGSVAVAPSVGPQSASVALVGRFR